MALKEDKFSIDIDKVLKKRLGDKAWLVPKFIVSWIKRTIHQDWITNTCQKKAADKKESNGSTVV